MKRWMVLWSLASYIFMMSSMPSHSRVYIDINSPGGTRIPVALLYQGTSETEDIVKKDLSLYGIFHLISPNAFITKEFEEGKFADWRTIGAEILVVVDEKRQEDSIMIEGHIFDVVEGKEVLAKRYSTGIAAERLAAHALADDVFYAFTGERGILSHPVALSVKVGQRAKELFIMDPDGLWKEQITHDKSIALSPNWSPDGKKLAYVSFKKGDADIYILNLETGEDKLLVGGQGVQSAPAWSPDGRYIAYSSSQKGNSEIYLINLSSRRRIRLTHYYGIDTSPTWSPDGEWIAFVSDRSGPPHIFVMRRDGSEIRRLTYGDYDVSPAWSPTGDLIAYSSLEKGHYYVRAVTYEGANDVTLVSGESPCWAPNGRYLLFYRGLGRDRRLFLTSSQGGGSIFIKQVDGGKVDWSSKFKKLGGIK
jgi:TolB protein